MLKRFLCVLLTAVMVFAVAAMIPISAYAESSMTISSECLDMIKDMEGFHAIPYWDYGQWTVGFGSTCPEADRERYTTEGIPIDEAEQLLRDNMAYHNNQVNLFAEKYNLTLTQNQFDALVSFTYNCGPAWIYSEGNALVAAILRGATGNEFIGTITAWCSAGGEFLSGLMQRRLAEADIYLNGHYQWRPAANYCYVRYSYEGATCASKAQGYDSNMPAYPMYTPVREGYVFTGWYTAEEGGVRVTSLDESTNGLMLYAHWAEETGNDENTDTAITVTVTGDVVNVRNGPGTTYGIVATVVEGAKLDITNVQTVSGVKWGKCEKGWICLQYTNYDVVISGGDTTPDDNISDGEETLPSVPSKGTIIGTDSVTVYNGPHTSYPKRGTVARGTVVEFVEIVDFLGYRWGRYADGWICIDNYVLLHDETFLYNTFTVTVTNSWLNVRSGPGTSYSWVASLTTNDVVEILALQEVGEYTWGRYEKGWICLYYTNYDPSMVPDQTPPKEDCTEHDYESVVTEPTCEAGGYTTHTCKNCGYSYTDSETEALGHDYDSVVTDPTCEAGGYTTHTCGNCGHSYTDSETEALGHDYDSVVTAPTCEDDGYTTHTCGNCGHSYTDSETKALGHDDESVVTLPTTTEKGYTTHTCKNCGHSYVDSYTDPISTKITVTKIYAVVTVDSLNIRSGAGTGYSRVGTYARGTRLEILEETTAGGNIWGRTDKGWVCLSENTTVETVTEEVNFGDVDTIWHVFAKVTVSSLNIRSDAGTSYSRVGYYPNGTRVEILEQKTAGGNIWGRTDKGWICLSENTTLETTGEKLEHVHEYVDVVTAPTCQHGGYTTHTCTICGHSYTDSETDQLEHDYESVVTSPTCTAGGYTTHTCKHCGHSYTDSETAQLEHDYESVVTAPTCTAGGYTTHTCKHCGHSYTDSETAQLEHDYESVVTAPTCTAGGYTTHTCKHCGHSYTDSETTKLEHDYRDVVTPPTTTEKGYTTHICENCGHTYVDSYTDPLPEETTVTRTYATVTASVLYIRSGAGTNYGMVGYYFQGTEVEILEQKTVGSNVWGRTDKGWICLTGLTTLRTVTEKVEEEPAVHVFATVTASSLNIRSGAGTNYSRVGYYSKGTRVEILEQKTVGGNVWGRTDKGWICLTGNTTLETVE